MTREPLELFRKEALEDHQAGAGHGGDVLRLSSPWLNWIYALLVALTLAVLIFISIFEISRYAAGPVVIRAGEQMNLTVPDAGTVVAIDVYPGQRVEEGDVLLRLERSREQAEVDRIKREIELRLVDRLNSPEEALNDNVMLALTADRTFAEQRLDARTLRAPQPGIVSDVRVRSGQYLSPGETAVRLNGRDSTLKVIAVLPGHFRPQIEPGMTLRVELSGYPHTGQTATVTRIADDVIGPAEARRVLGADVADAVPISGAAVLVEAVIASREFTAAGRTLVYHDGMHGRAEIRLRSEPILYALAPGFRALREGSGD